MIIDDDLLSELVRDLGESVRPPAEGPGRILATAAAADPIGNRASPRAARRPLHLVVGAVALAAVIVAVVGVAVGGVGQSHDAQPQIAASLPTRAATSAGTTSSDFGAAATTVPSNAAAAEAAPSTTAGPAAPALAAGPTVATKVVKTGTVTVQVATGRVPTTVDTLTTTTAGLGGYVASSSSSDDGGSPTADLTLRVPAGQFEALLSRVEAVGTTQSVTTAGQDVTGQYVDLQARISALEASRQRYLDIMTGANTIGDVLAVQQQLDGLQSELEQLQGQLNVLTDQAAYATLTVHLQEPTRAPLAAPMRTPSGLSAAWRRARHNFAHGAESVVAASGGIAIFLVCAGALALLGRVVWTLARRRLV